jgi:hypothetical protein
MIKRKIKVGKIAGLLLVIAIGISLLFGTLGCAKEITEPMETPTPTTTPAPAPTAPSEPSTSTVDPSTPESTAE